ncbi:hypothetical protein NC651_005979 [Populus alba x Populus x berolinensis]|nr:hypothetical protein NC651_005979 [Populus alba x Populus x berolinensis]
MNSVNLYTSSVRDNIRGLEGTKSGKEPSECKGILREVLATVGVIKNLYRRFTGLLAGKFSDLYSIGIALRLSIRSYFALFFPLVHIRKMMYDVIS